MIRKCMEIGKVNSTRTIVNGPDLRQQSLVLAHQINAALFLFSCGKLKTSAKL